MRAAFNGEAGWIAGIFALLLLVACAAPAPPTAVPTKAPAAQPTQAAPAVATKPAEKAAEKPAAKATATAPTKAAMPAPLSPAVKLRIGSLGISDDGPIFLGTERGYFKELGLEVDWVPFDASSKVIPALAAGQLEIAGAGTTVALFNSFARGIGINAAATSAKTGAGHQHISLMIRKDLADKVKDFKDLKGLKIGVVSNNGPAYPEMGKILAKAGLSFNDVNLVYMFWPDQMAAFANKALDAGIVVEPFSTQAQEQGLAVNWKYAHPDFYPDHQTSVMLYAPQFMERQPEAARRFLIAYIRGIRDYLDAFDKGVNKDEVIRIMTKYTNVKDVALYNKMKVPGFDRNGYILTQHLKDDQDFFVSQGLINASEKANIDKLVNYSYLEYALGIVGKE
ncbi:MAG: ABC transporter substrate-binding protein [Chloroflexi bacterium]|nr:ABC transporter substrate-binding protein [Chloroflexota bacterium]